MVNLISQSFKSPKVRILTALGLFLALTTGGAIWLGFAVKDQVKEAADDLSPALSGDVIAAAFDDQKGVHLAKGEWKVFDAHRYAYEKNYKKAHDSYIDARDEFTQALGKDSPMTYAVVGLQAHFEYEFRKYPLAEDLFRQELTSLEKTKQRKQVFFTQKWLASALAAQYKMKEETTVLLDALAIARQLDEKDASHRHIYTLDALYRLSWAYHRSKQFDKAEDICAQEVSIVRQLRNNKMLVDKLNDLASAKSRNGDPAGAIKVSSEALSIDPANIGSYRKRARAYAHMHDYKHAIEDMTNAVKLDAKDENWTLWVRAEIYEESGEYQRAIDDYTATTGQKLPEGRFNWALYNRRAGVEEKAGRLKDAISDYTEILKHTEGPNTYVGRGDVYVKMHEPELAIEDYTKALKITENAKPIAKFDWEGYQRDADYPLPSSTIYEKRAQAYSAIGKKNLAAADRLRAQQKSKSDNESEDNVPDAH